VSCGGIDAPSCTDCGDNASFCNGECEWIADECKLKNQSAAPSDETPNSPVIGGRQLVSCGGHTTTSCADCGEHAYSCNGECEWLADKCKPKNQSAAPSTSAAPSDAPNSPVIGGTPVSCGGHDAPSCADCGEHAYSCNGECKWMDNVCQTESTVQVLCGDTNDSNIFSTCEKCGGYNASFCNGECIWIGNVCGTTFQAQVRCGDSDDSKIVSTCDKCGGEENCNGECKWSYSECKKQGMNPEHRTKIIVSLLGAVGAIGAAAVTAWLGRKKLCCCSRRKPG